MIHFRNNVFEKMCTNTAPLLDFTFGFMPQQDGCWRPAIRVFIEKRKFSSKLAIKLNLKM
jgi:hypothetical protein